MQPKVQKWLAADDLVVRPMVRVLALPEGSLPPPASIVETRPSLEEVRAMIDQIDLLRSHLQTAQEKVEELESHNRTLGAALDKIEAAQKAPKAVPDVTPPEVTLEPPPPEVPEVPIVEETPPPPEEGTPADGSSPAGAAPKRSHKKAQP